MVGAFDLACSMESRQQALGYRDVVWSAPSVLGQAGTKARGHEFHYSRIQGEDAAASQVYQVSDRSGRTTASGGWRKGNCLGSYIHLHFGSNPDLATNFVTACAP